MNPLSLNVPIELLQKQYEQSSDAIIFFDAQHRIMAMNPQAEKLLDRRVLEESADTEHNAFCFSCRGYTSEDEPMSCINCYLSNTKKDFSSFQLYLETKTKGVVPFSASFQTVDQESGVRVLILRDLTNPIMTQQMLNRNTMMKSIIKAQEDERKRISRELHDSVAQELISSLVDLRVLKYLNVQEEALQKIQQTEASLTRLLEQIRNLSVELRPASLDDLGLDAAFRSHFKWIEKNYGVVVRFVAELGGQRFNSEVETVVYRVCQESVLNALKYANVDEIDVRLFASEHTLELVVSDQGCGFNVNANDPKGTGLGIYGMKERAELVGGEITVTSQRGKGTTVHLRIPLAAVTP
ncbi:ATP-binding protein [Paenibacillus sp. MB22_1]|jgi:two-component system sensor histidine kinase NreB|uniref:sensor histidine kinase n=1 Tax=Paenibacillus TaxID=44249 RepID=UPI0001AFD119|nr:MULTISPECIES: ATP-binding protein [Paenibacillus]EES75333.1 oxygen sensor histidine kinase NreB [Paenibacillus sp. oral taxon 786 str. D14]MCT2194049.1 ATP-binding protein [Paenibacillus sp. p3-SID1389]MDU0331445.1 ATP-binding protein [Paenibacillus sp. 3LSP]SMF53433.1 two-component system, NarL family, sensor histidine kinase NreB [Paenibacillus barengoltzii]